MADLVSRVKRRRRGDQEEGARTYEDDTESVNLMKENRTEPQPWVGGGAFKRGASEQGNGKGKNGSLDRQIRIVEGG